MICQAISPTPSTTLPHYLLSPLPLICCLEGWEGSSAQANPSALFLASRLSTAWQRLSSKRSRPVEPGACLVLYKLSPPRIGMHLWLLNMAACCLFWNTWVCAPFLTSLLRDSLFLLFLLPFKNLWHATGSQRPPRCTYWLRCFLAATETRPDWVMWSSLGLGCFHCTQEERRLS